MQIAIDARYLRASEREVLPSGGIGRYVHHLVTELLALDAKLRLLLVVPAGNRRPIVIGRDAERVREHAISAPPQSLRTLLSFARAIDLRGVDVLHCPANVLPFGLRHPAVTTIHDLMWLDEPALCASSRLKRLVTGSYYRAGITQAAERSAQVLTVSAASQQALLARFPDLAARVTVTPHGLDGFFSPVELSEAEAVSSDIVPAGTPFVLCVGQGSPYKNHRRALLAFAEAFAGEPEVKLVLVRRFTRADRELSELLARPELRGRVLSLPEIAEPALRALYARASVFLFPSLCEGFGMPLLEAMACGCPVLTADFGAMAEVSGDAALGVDTRSIDAIADGLRRLHGSPELRTTLRARGLLRVRSFTWRNTAERTLAVYRRAAGNLD
jgi:glycosyltransferase involved in cell wall biosynthesis